MRRDRNLTPEQKRIRKKINGWWKDGTSRLITTPVSIAIECSMDLAADEYSMTPAEAKGSKLQKQVEDVAIARLEDEIANLQATLDNIKEDRELLWLHKAAQGG